MPLSPDDVQNKRFTVVRFKFGYDEEEVDNFLDEIEEELRRLISENRALHTAATRVPGAPGPTAVLPPALPHAVPPPQPSPQVVMPPPQPVPAPPPPPAPIAIPELAGLSGLADTDDTALRTLMLAQRTAEDAIAKAHADAEEILNGARAKATALEQELRAVHAGRLAALEKERSGLVEEIAALRGFEREFRNRLRMYLQSTIGDLDARPSVEPAQAQPVAAAQVSAETQSVGRHSAPMPQRPPQAPPPQARPPQARPPQAPAPQAPQQPAAQPVAPAQPPAQPSAHPPAAVPPVAPPAAPPPPPPNPFSSAPPPAGPPAQA
ncbi:MAG TPA: DivIVA domain-containing protein [Mycobacteriales bacterium]|nr:DivIVA domain-containing protein [Mycobacteriales bacterium]